MPIRVGYLLFLHNGCFSAKYQSYDIVTAPRNAVVLFFFENSFTPMINTVAIQTQNRPQNKKIMQKCLRSGCFGGFFIKKYIINCTNCKNSKKLWKFSRDCGIMIQWYNYNV